MTAWTDILAEAIAASGQPGNLSSPSSLLKLCDKLDEPLTTLSGRDTERGLFAALDEDVGFVRPVRSSRLIISAAQKEKLANSIRWLIANLSGWRQPDDPKRARLVAMIVLAARLDENSALWMLMPDKIIRNQELAREIQDILGRLQFRVEAASFSRSPVVDSEQMAEFITAEAEQNWPALRIFVENVPWHFYSNAILDQSVRLLSRFFPDQLLEVGRAVSQVGLAMQMITAISVADAFRWATRSANNILQFAAVCRLFTQHDQVRTLDSAQEAALVGLLVQVATDAPRWSAWMQAFAAYPYTANLIQPAIGACLAVSDEAALRAYIDAIYLQASWLGREEVKICLIAFATYVSLERRRVAWSLAYARWSAWNFGEQDGHSAPTAITVSNIDFAIVGYATECLSPEEREGHIVRCLDRIRGTEHVWHTSQLSYMHEIYRALSGSQPFLHACDCDTAPDNWLWDKVVYYLFDELHDPYWQLRYGLRNIPNPRSQKPMLG